eukprot:TRINITY_DN27473_c0_g1_i1.p1 TRINITY_DN27473_c0_g1~~TRINITY_DN27473_c0_g1_i1.p1  ORF type:complete len:415 (+),score=74.48 TRINITY_DN27473_c0_g1_i1:153-1397(+)
MSGHYQTLAPSSPHAGPGTPMAMAGPGGPGTPPAPMMFPSGHLGAPPPSMPVHHPAAPHMTVPPPSLPVQHAPPQPHPHLTAHPPPSMPVQHTLAPVQPSRPLVQVKSEAKPVAAPPPSPRMVFLVTGFVLLGLVCSVPMMNAVMLIRDMNYVFWVGVNIPLWIIFLCLGVVLAYAITILVIFRRPRPQAESEQTILMIANVFITVLGLTFMLLAMPLSRQATETYDNLMNRCETSPQTVRTYEYSQVLHNIRAMPDCYAKYSVEECTGYEEAHPYTDYLKALEREFRCSGFCYRPPSSYSLLQTTENATREQEATSSASERRFLKSGRSAALLQVEQPAKTVEVLREGKAPTLFSDADYSVSCTGMAARDMKLFAGDVAHQTFYQGLYLIIIAITTGFLKLIGFCLRAENEFK